jgi:hypothetical protein
MNLALVAAAAVVVGGGVVCLSARDPRLALAGLAVTLFVAPLIADPLPEPVVLAARVVSAALAVYLPWIVIRDPASATRGSLLGWPVEALVAAAAFVIGFGTAGLGAPPVGPPEAQGAGFALVALSVGPIVFGRDVFRLGSGAVLLVGGTLLIRVGLGGTPSALEQLVTGVLFVGLGGGVAFLAANAVAAGTAGGAVLDEGMGQPGELGGLDVPGDRQDRAHGTTRQLRGR